MHHPFMTPPGLSKKENPTMDRFSNLPASCERNILGVSDSLSYFSFFLLVFISTKMKEVSI
jgi:hypothetical protein